MKKNIDIRKASVFAVVINTVQIVAVLAISAYVVLGDFIPALDETLVDAFVVFVAALVVVGAGMDIREAIAARKVLEKLDAMDDSVTQMEQLNGALRAQRHDFLNHLQVVYSLMEMEETKDAMEYIEKVYGDIQALSRDMRTGSPAVNALLRVKLASCQRADIRTETDITGSWTNLPMPAWAFCRVLSNLIDNAMDALRDTERKCLRIMLREDLHGFQFAVRNSGPMIPKDKQMRIFDPGWSTKGAERGMGLAIVKDTLLEYGGNIKLISNASQTEFAGFIPKAQQGGRED